MGAGCSDTRPSLLVNSDWSRDGLGGYVGVDDERYLDQPQQSFTNWTASLGWSGASGPRCADRVGGAFRTASVANRAGRAAVGRAVAYRVDDVRASYLATFDRLSIHLGVAFSTYRYDATTIFGVPTSQAYRNRDVLRGEVTTRYELSPDRNALLVMRVLDQSTIVAPQAGQPTHDSTGYQMLVGLSDDRDADMALSRAGGMGGAVFRASAYKAHQAPIVEAALIWAPSGMTTVTARVTRSIEDAAQEGVAGLHLFRGAAGGGPRVAAQCAAAGLRRHATG